MADSEVRQKFEARVLETVKYSKRKDFVVGENGYDNPNLQEWFGWFAAGMRAGEIAMREKAAELREALKLICAEAESWHTMHDHDGNGLVQCDSICALIPRMKLAISGAEESKKEKA